MNKIEALKGIIEELKFRNDVLQDAFEDTLIEHSNLLDAFMDLEEERDKLKEECEKLRKENKVLRDIITKHLM